MKTKKWFTYVFLIYSLTGLVMVVDYLLYRFWDIGTETDDFRNFVGWICLLPLWIYFFQKNKKPPADAPSEAPDGTPTEDE